MEKICMLPKFLQSENINHSIISVKHIINIKYSELNRYEILFVLDNGSVECWEFKELGQAEFIYRIIMNQLSDRKLIVNNKP